MPAPSETPLEIRPAATVVVLRDRLSESQTGLEVLMLKRAANLAFFGGAWVFPGGKAEPEDGDLVNALPEAARTTAVRELFEETGLTVDAADLVAFARWITPPDRPRRFDTFYFAANAPNAEIRLDPRESDDHRWITPREALETRARGEIELPPPTFVTLAQLADVPTAKEACVRLAAHRTEYVPRPCQIDGGVVYLYAGDAGYETSDVHAPGARHRLTTSTHGPWRYDRPS
jgi:8-oxo-dGTP pyrophosphatase MutT (NUDIX family)